jgi:hypothetical protein
MNASYLNLVNLLHKVELEFSLISRIVYKVKNQFRRMKQFKYIQELKKKIGKIFFTLQTEDISNKVYIMS